MMKELNNKELKEIVGGISITGTLINAAVSVYNTILGFGQSLGSAVRRIMSGNLCEIK